ncbi:carbonic anhydrase [Paracoccus methylarcula]|uniref:Carbonic anhydrase n=1 Tax=Paracoccus methylarcula TaxID=72022 RepID=A0A3R7MB70_9RHOB|nr:carbonic anhydrase [Paracoccus methylarcula]RNF36311.1 carbonic anhydrase [Paracoccus methylarcula]
MLRYIAILLCLPHIALANDLATHWSYKGKTGPEHWAELDPQYRVCKIGRSQSPIDLTDSNARGEVEFTASYKPLPMTIWNNGHTIQLDATNSGALTEDGKDFPLLQVHFHDPSEHAIHGKHFPLEVHFVHRSADGQLAVLAVLIDEGKENPELAKIIQHLPRQSGEPQKIDGVEFDPAALLPKSLESFRYSGSLTTPPCSEGVAWHVLSTPITASADQITALSEVMGENNRPVQAVNDRLVIQPKQ